MTQEDKKLLLEDLCGRLPYGVKVRDELGRINKLVIGNADLIRLYYNDFSIYSEEKLSLPYLFPMSSMTEEQEKEYDILRDSVPTYHYEFGDVMVDDTKLCDNWKSIDYLNAHHFDYRGLIEKGLAIDATNLNIYRLIY